MYLIGLDVGTTGVKAVAFDSQGNQQGLAYRNYEYEAVRGKRELLADNLWESTRQALMALIKSIPARKRAAICVSSFGEGFVCLDEKGEALSPVMLLTDDRGSREFDELLEVIGEERTAKICGLKPHMSYSLSKLLYLKKYCSDIWKRTRRVLLVGDYIYYKLGGECYTDYSMASRTMLFDVHKKVWSRELMEAAGLSEDYFSRPVQGGSIIGKASRQMTQELGLPQDTTLVMGGHDQAVAAVVSRSEKHYTLCSMGTSESIDPILKEPMPWQKILANAHPNEPYMEEGMYNTLAYNVTSGLLTEWSTKVLTKAERSAGEDVYQLLEKEMPEDPTRLLVLPYLHGSGTPYLDANARLAILGMDEVTRRGDIYKGILEGLCMDQRLNLEKLGWEYLGEDGLLVTGGGSRSDAWVQIKADILDRPIHRLCGNQAGALGCAILCAAALGVYPSKEEAAKTMVRVGEEFLPNSSRADFYREKFEIYKSLHADCRRANIYTSNHI